jgi:hypothetical protein
MEAVGITSQIMYSRTIRDSGFAVRSTAFRRRLPAAAKPAGSLKRQNAAPCGSISTLTPPRTAPNRKIERPRMTRIRADKIRTGWNGASARLGEVPQSALQRPGHLRTSLAIEWLRRRVAELQVINRVTPARARSVSAVARPPQKRPGHDRLYPRVSASSAVSLLLSGLDVQTCRLDRTARRGYVPASPISPASRFSPVRFGTKFRLPFSGEFRCAQSRPLSWDWFALRCCKPGAPRLRHSIERRRSGRPRAHWKTSIRLMRLAARHRRISP